MFHSFITEGERIDYTLRVSTRARRVRILVSKDGVVLIVPKRVDAERALSFMKEKASWLRKHIQAQKIREKHALALNQTGSYDEYKEKAYHYVTEKVLLYSGLYGVAYGMIRVKNQKTVWGSCSRTRNLNFNYRIMFLPEHLREYIVVHEVCHLLQFNHSKHFWALVAKQIPGYKACVQELRAYAYSLS